MDFFSAQQFFANMFPGKAIAYVFDKSCVRQLEMVVTDGLPNVYHHVEFQKVKVSVEGMPDQYVPIDPHRANISWASFVAFVSEVQDINITDNFFDAFKNNDENQKKTAVDDLVNLTGLSAEKISSKAQAFLSKPAKEDAAKPPIAINM